MIHLDKGQVVKDHPELVVYDETGDYNDADMVRCAKISNQFEPFCWYEAQYISYGGMVYSISDDTQLATEIAKIDPDTTIMEVAPDSPAVSSEQSSNPTTETSPQQVDTSAQETTPVSTPTETQPAVESVSHTTDVPASEALVEPVSSGTPEVLPGIDAVSTPAPGTISPDIIPATDVINTDPQSPVSVIMRKRRRKLKLS